MTAAEELLQLSKSAEIAQKSGVSKVVTQRMANQAQQALNAVWGSAERVASVQAQNVTYDAVKQHMEREAATLERLIQAIRKNRETLAALTLSGESRETLEQVELNVRMFGEVIGDVNTLQ